MTAEQMARGARTAGFTGDGLVTIVAISGAESGYEDATMNTARPDRPGYHPLTRDQVRMGWQGEYSVGPLMIDLQQHDDISESEARTFFGAAQWAFVASSGGRWFTPWSTYTGAGMPAGSHPPYLDRLAEARAAVAATETPQPVTDWAAVLRAQGETVKVIKQLDIAQADVAIEVARAGVNGGHSTVQEVDVGDPSQVGVLVIVPRADAHAGDPNAF